MLIVETVLTILVLVLALGVARWSGSRSESLPVTTEWLEDISEDRYRPMLRLLEETDFRFLRAQKGFTPAMEERLRSQRVELFRMYLNMLESDFRRVSMALKMMMIESEYDRPDLASALLTRELNFTLGVLTVQFRLKLFQWGCSGVDASALVDILDGMRLELKTLVLSAPVAA